MPSYEHNKDYDASFNKLKSKGTKVLNGLIFRLKQYFEFKM
jgi:hypothetical protein